MYSLSFDNFIYQYKPYLILRYHIFSSLPVRTTTVIITPL